MKINVEIDVTPEELRTFLGLPDVKSLQDELLSKFHEQIQTGMDGFDPVAMMQPFVAPNVGAMETMQRAFWQAFMNGTMGGETDDKSK